MSGAGFILAINISIAGLFATAFLLIALYEKSYIAARWLALAYVLGMVNVGMEFVIPALADARFAVVVAYSAFLAALVAVNAGVARRYDVPTSWLLLGTVFFLSVALHIMTRDMPRESLFRMFIYQSPHFVLQAICAWTVLRSKSRRTIDIGLFALLSASALHFLTKPFLAAAFGGMGANPQAYVSTQYAMYSQSIGAVLAIATGLLMLGIFMRDILSAITAKSVTDVLSGLLNRRGFEERAYPLLAGWQRGAVPVSLVICDLDHFKSVNDTHGHASGDKVIETFAQVLREAAAEHCILGRIGGEEFAVILPGATLSAARLFAENVRQAFAFCSVHGLPEDMKFTASFGVAELLRDDTLSDLLRRADMALYDAKESGRDCVRTCGSTRGRSLRSELLLHAR